jgi:sugar/nucleoside kinase (ribokinase family)
MVVFIGVTFVIRFFSRKEKRLHNHIRSAALHLVHFKPAFMTADLCCIGHITVDRVVTPEATVTMPGGTAFYFSHALANLPLRFALVTALAQTEMPVVEALRKKGLSVTVLPSTSSVYFENRYNENQDQRTQKVLRKAAPFDPALFSTVEASIFHLGPLLADDFSAEDIRALAAKGKLSLDVQGFLRKVENENVVPVDWAEKKAVLPLIHFFKASEEEAQVLTGTGDMHESARQLADWGAREVVITFGSKGSLVFDGENFYSIPAFPPEQVVDATGCGDTYMAGYLYCRCKGAGVQEAGEYAAAMATAKISVSGPFTGREEDVKAVLTNSKRFPNR